MIASASTARTGIDGRPSLDAPFTASRRCITSWFVALLIHARRTVRADPEVPKLPFHRQGKETLTIGPLRIEVERGTMPPEEIRLWPENPRTKHYMARFDTYPSEEDLIAAIIKVQPTNYRNLSRDIEKFGQQEPVFLKAETND